MLIHRFNDDIVEIETAWWLLQEFNSQSYVKKILDTPTSDPPLLNIECVGVVAHVRGPRPGVLPGKTIQEALHIIDSTTPIDQEYDMMHPRELDIEVASYSIRMRDYSFPIFDLPATGISGQKAWKTSGYIIVTEQIARDVSILRSSVSVSPLPYPPIEVKKTINPVKIYMNLETFLYVSSGSSFRLRWGANLDPALTDSMRILDSFTRQNVDPSPIGGWWDKLRTVLHGKVLNSFLVTYFLCSIE